MTEAVRSRSRWRSSGLLPFLVLGACSSEVFIPAPVPPPVHEHVVAAPIEKALGASVAALGALGFTPAEVDDTKARVVSHFRPLDGNRDDHRTRGVGRLTFERDVYSGGEARLVVQMAPEREATRVRVFADVRGRVARRGEVHYEPPPPASAVAPIDALAGGAAPAEKEGWQRLGSNGVLEDEFLAAFLSELDAGQTTSRVSQ